MKKSVEEDKEELEETPVEKEIKEGKEEEQLESDDELEVETIIQEIKIFYVRR